MPYWLGALLHCSISLFTNRECSFAFITFSYNLRLSTFITKMFHALVGILKSLIGKKELSEEDKKDNERKVGYLLVVIMIILIVLLLYEGRKGKE